MTKALIQLFAKPPIAGMVKTRLIPDIGTRPATAIYKHCLQSNIELLKKSSFEYQIWLTEPSDHDLFQHQDIHYQQGNNLGERMYHALFDALSRQTDKVILIGSDCLDLSPSLLQKVCEKLEQHELVLIPALDGGYVLIAAKNSIDPVLFRHIDWGSEKVLLQTMESAMFAGINTFILNPLRDIDRINDVKHYTELKQYL